MEWLQSGHAQLLTSLPLLCRMLECMQALRTPDLTGLRWTSLLNNDALLSIGDASIEYFELAAVKGAGGRPSLQVV